MQDSSPLIRVSQEFLLTSYLPQILMGCFWPSTFIFKGFLVLTKYLYSYIHIRIITSTIKDKAAWPTRALWTPPLQKLGLSIQKPDRSSLPYWKVCGCAWPSPHSRKAVACVPAPSCVGKKQNFQPQSKKRLLLSVPRTCRLEETPKSNVEWAEVV